MPKVLERPPTASLAIHLRKFFGGGSKSSTSLAYNDHVCAMGFYIRMHDYNSLNLINITQNLLHGTTSSKAKSRSRNPLWFYVPDSLCWKKHTLHFQTLTVGLNELLNSRSHMRNKTEIKLDSSDIFEIIWLHKIENNGISLNTIALIYT